MKDTILIMSANPYSIVDERTGAINEGISINYCMTRDLLPNGDDKGFLGYRILKGSIPKDNKDNFKMVPGYYETEFQIKPDSSGKATLKPFAVKFVKAVQV